jgi:hypothetical protein
LLSLLGWLVLDWTGCWVGWQLDWKLLDWKLGRTY